MSHPIFRYFLATVIAVTIFAGPAFAQSVCTSRQYKAVGKLALSLAKCKAKAVKLGVSEELSCPRKAIDKLIVKWFKATARFDCVTQQDHQAAQALTESYLADLMTMLETSP